MKPAWAARCCPLYRTATSTGLWCSPQYKASTRLLTRATGSSRPRSGSRGQLGTQLAVAPGSSCASHHDVLCDALGVDALSDAAAAVAAVGIADERCDVTVGVGDHARAAVARSASPTSAVAVALAAAR